MWWRPKEFLILAWNIYEDAWNFNDFYFLSMSILTSKLFIEENLFNKKKLSTAKIFSLPRQWFDYALICFCSLASCLLLSLICCEVIVLHTYIHNYLIIKYMCMCHVNTKKLAELGVFGTRMTQSIHLNFFPIYFCSFSQHHQSYLFQNHFLPCSKLLFLLFFFCLPLLPTKVKQPHKKYFVIKEKKIAYQKNKLKQLKNFFLKGLLLGEQKL